ncbi:transmembrane protein 154 isoform X2 [Malaclemys terrapin pileata]|uniref:transmembrane protein 154 isoform X2 n=1 Tax=Malaclemys terrapin pileata TaxID=2991368 RepID=UPI0023A7A2AC|nr:transmembrane protein 154 isoform X2 [Malaclemys terrapin pileata]
MPNHKKCIIQKQNFMLFFVLFLTAGSPRYGTANEEASGDGSPALNIKVTPRPETSAEYFTTADELGSENVKSPIFEEDTPSVMEIEMEELDKWMNSMNKNADGECLPTVKEEEKESNVFTSDCES